MISDDKGSVLVSCMGWVDHGDLWVLDASSGVPSRLSIGSRAKYLHPHSGTNGYFAVGHHFDGPQFEVTVHAFTKPASAVARASVTASGAELSGDASVWKYVPRLYVPFIALPGLKDFVLFRIDPVRASASVQALAWYDDRFDKGYQGVVSVTELPDEVALFSVQRSSELVLHDLQTGAQRGVVDLGGRHGNPHLDCRRLGASVSAFTTTEKLMQTFRLSRDLVTFLKSEATRSGIDLTAHVTRILDGTRTWFGLPAAATTLLEADREALGMERHEYLLHLLYQRSLELREKGPGFDAPSTGKDRKKK